MLLFAAQIVSAQCGLNNINTNPDPAYVQPTTTTGSEYKTNGFKWWDVDGFQYDNLSTVEAFINLSVYFKFPDAYGLHQGSFQKIRYPIKFNSVTSPLVPTSNFVNVNNFPTDLNIGTTTYSSAQTIYSYGTVTISGDLQNTSGGTIIIEAQNEIDVSPGVTIDPGIILQIQPSLDLCNGLTPTSPQHPDQVYCTQTDYKGNQIANKTDAKIIGNKVNEVLKLKLNLYPNPTTDVCHVAFDMPVAADIEIDMLDMMGREVQQIKHGWSDQGSNRTDFNTKDIASGVYLVKYTDSEGNLVTKQLVINHNDK